MKLDESENEVKKQINEFLEKAGYTLFRLNNAPVGFKRFHGKKGLSDTIAFKPGEYALLIEGKGSGKKPSKEQSEFLALANKSKGLVGLWADSFDMFMKIYNTLKGM